MDTLQDYLLLSGSGVSAFLYASVRHGSLSALSEYFPVWMAVAAMLGWHGAEFVGSRRFRLPVIRNLLAMVLALAGTKMILTA